MARQVARAGAAARCHINIGQNRGIPQQKWFLLGMMCIKRPMDCRLNTQQGFLGSAHGARAVPSACGGLRTHGFRALSMLLWLYSVRYGTGRPANSAAPLHGHACSADSVLHSRNFDFTSLPDFRLAVHMRCARGPKNLRPKAVDITACVHAARRSG